MPLEVNIPPDGRSNRVLEPSMVAYFGSNFHEVNRLNEDATREGLGLVFKSSQPPEMNE